MMRQLGGSFGIAIITTFMAQQVVRHHSHIADHIEITNPAVQNRLNGLQQAFIMKGHTPDIAKLEAYKAIDYSVTKQAMVLSYMDVFFWIGIMFLVVIPFVLLVRARKKAGKVDMSNVH